ncbi:MAG: ABC transporter permease [Candidatus Berkiella sp.]
MNAIYILWLRQLKRYFRSRARIIGSMGQPIMFLLAFGFGFKSLYQVSEGGNYIQFMAPGVMAMGILFLGAFNGIEMIWDRQFGFLKETFVAPVSRLKIIFGRTLGGATVALFQGLIVLLICSLVGFRIQSFTQLPLALLFMFLIALFCSSLGAAIACVVEDLQGFPVIMNFIILPLFFFSNALFPIHSLPKALLTIIHINPLSYGIDGLRGALTQSSHYSVALDLGVLSVAAISMLVIASVLFSRIEL